jgi:hypothetical protein
MFRRIVVFFILKQQVGQDKLTQFWLVHLTFGNKGSVFVLNVGNYLHSDALALSRRPESIMSH